ncbi:MAG: hypothetical protein FRX49_09215 [Trebouxia sp. A1-2]|nr:MAG: hypothetical protein FRX49_09215 [Trebouxia sp. A1-2]
MDVVSCAELLTSLMTKSLSFPNCTVKIPLRPPELKASSYGVRSGVFQRVDEIAYAVSQLRANGVIIYICIQAAGSTDLPALDVMESVASVIHEVDYAQPASMTSTSWRPKRYERFSEDHLWALESARKQMQVLCISDALTPHQFRGEYIGLVASFRQLKKLVLQTNSISILEKAFRAQQEVGLASPRIRVILPPDARYADPTEKGRQHFFIDYTKRPVFCDRMSAERKPTVTAAQQFLRKVGKPVQSWVRQRAPARTGRGGKGLSHASSPMML